MSVAKALQWRVVRTREEAQTTVSPGPAPSVPVCHAPPESLTARGVSWQFVADEEELVVRMAEARKVFTEFDADGGGSIDAKELVQPPPSACRAASVARRFGHA